jgi:hypothetical protein
VAVWVCRNIEYAISLLRLKLLWYVTAVTYVPKAIINTWQRAVDMYIFRATVEPSRAATNPFHLALPPPPTLQLPHIRCMLKRQRLSFLMQIVNTPPTSTGFSWSTLSQIQLDRVCSPPGRPGRHNNLWLNITCKHGRASFACGASATPAR